MGKVFLNPSGDGYAYCVPPAGEELVNGESFTIHFVPDAGATLDDVRAFDSRDYPVALPSIVNNEVSMNFRSSWSNLYVDIYFSGSPTPPTPPTFNIPIWLLKKIADNNRRRK